MFLWSFCDSVVTGMTLMEVMIAVSIVAILTSMALPQYRKTLEVNYRRQAQDLLTTIYYGERAYRLANNKFIDPVGNWNTIFMDNPQVGASPPINFAVAVAAGPPPTFTASATRAAGSGPCAGLAMTIDENRNLGGAWLLPTPCP